MCDLLQELYCHYMSYTLAPFKTFLKTIKRTKEIMEHIGNITYDHMVAHNIGVDTFNDKDALSALIESVYITAYSLFTQEELLEIDFEEKCKSQIVKELELRAPVQEPILSKRDIIRIKKQIRKLDKVLQPAQRTPEWHIFRSNRLTASDFGTAVNVNPYSDRKQLIRKKCGENQPFIAGPAILHGVKYEDVAIAIYENRNNVIIKEYGCIPHPILSYIGASPDGICSPKSANKNYIGRMLEIKCPKSRKLNGTIPEYYHLQVQGQLEVCELEYCDFLQCVIHEVSNETFFNDVREDGNHNYLSNGMEKGVLIEYYDNKQKKDAFLYAPLTACNTKYDIEEWIDNSIDSILDRGDEFLGIKYWILHEYSCRLVQRDLVLWEELEEDLTKFWNDVLHYRKIGYESLKRVKTTKSNNISWELKEAVKYHFAEESEDEEV